MEVYEVNYICYPSLSPTLYYCIMKLCIDLFYCTLYSPTGEYGSAGGHHQGDLAVCASLPSAGKSRAIVIGRLHTTTADPSNQWPSCQAVD